MFCGLSSSPFAPPTIIVTSSKGSIVEQHDRGSLILEELHLLSDLGKNGELKYFASSMAKKLQASAAAFLRCGMLQGSATCEPATGTASACPKRP